MYKKALICLEFGSDLPEVGHCLCSLQGIGVKECLVVQFVSFSEAITYAIA